MKRLATVFLLLALASNCAAAVFFTDPFSYPNGQLTGLAGGANVSGGLWNTHDDGGTAGVGEYVDVVDGKVELLTDGGEDVNRLTGSTMNTGQTWYLGTTFTVNDTRVNNTNAIAEEWFIGFYNGFTGANNRSTARVWIDDPTTESGTTHYGLRLSSSSVGSGIVTKSVPTDLAYGSTHTVIASYAFDTGFVSLWLDPEVGDFGTPDVTDTTGNTNGIQVPIQSLQLRQASASNTPRWQNLVDIVSTGDDFAQVLAELSPVNPGQPGDFDGDLDVDGRDFLIWQRGGSTPGGALSASDLQDWQDNYGVGPLASFSAVPEPGSMCLAAFGLAGILLAKRQR